MPYLNQPKEILPDTITFSFHRNLEYHSFYDFSNDERSFRRTFFTIGVTKATIFANIINVILNYVL